MIGKPIEFAPKLYATPSEHAFTNPVTPSVYTEGVKPNLGYVRSLLDKHPDFPHALNLLIEKWGHKDFSPNRVQLYSYGQRVAIATPKSEQQLAKLEVLVDLDEFREKNDPHWHAFEELLFVNLALYAGSQEKTPVEPSQYEAPPYTTTIPSNLFSQAAIHLLSFRWEGLEEVVFTAKDKNGIITKKISADVDVYDGKDYQFRLDIISTERILSLAGKEIARVVSRYASQPGNKEILPNDASPIPLPVITAPEVVVVGSSEQERYEHLELIIGKLSDYMRGATSKVATTQEKETTTTPAEKTIFEMPSLPTTEVHLAAD